MTSLIDDIDNSLLSMKPFHHNVSGLVDLSDEILLLICRYLSPYHVLHCFYTPEIPDARLHRLIFDYYTKIKLDAMKYNEYSYFISLFLNTNYPLQPQSLTLSDEHISGLIELCVFYIPSKPTQTIFTNLKHLTLINCSSANLSIIDKHWMNYLTKIEYIHITIRKSGVDANIRYTKDSDTFIKRLVFAGKMCFLHTIKIESYAGYSLYKTLIPHQNLRHIEIALQTIDDLYILLNQLVPNVQTLIVQLFQTRILPCRRPQCKSPCLRLTEFTLLEYRIGLVIDDITSILCSMPSLIKLTLNIRDTPDPIFSHGSIFESMLSQYVPHLRQFDYTMTHRIIDQRFVEDFIRYPMNIVFYENENCQWVHIYSLPWPSSKDDKRRIPIVNSGLVISVESNVKRALDTKNVMITKHSEFFELSTHFRRACHIKTCLEIDIIFPQRISKLILTKETPISSINSIIQPSIRHLVVERRLKDEKEICFLAHQFPNVKYLQLLFPFDKSLFVHCFKTLFSNDDKNDKRCFWSELIHFSTVYVYEQSLSVWNDSTFHNWLIENTDLKFHSMSFYPNNSNSIFSIWF